MADRACNYCEDQGDCTRCSPFFEPDRLHSKCGKPWREHVTHLQPESNQGIYPPWLTCPAASGTSASPQTTAMQDDRIGPDSTSATKS